jgi:hypothetical protein
MSVVKGFTDDSTVEPLHRWMTMNGWVERIDHFDRLFFLDAVANEWVTRFGGIHDIDLWQQIPNLEEPVLKDFLDAVAVVLEELTDWDDIEIIVPDFIDSPQPMRDPHLAPKWWPFDLTREEKEWIARHKRINAAMEMLDSEGEAEIYADALHELRHAHILAPTVRSFLERGEIFRDTFHFLIPALEAELEQRGFLPPPRKGTQ